MEEGKYSTLEGKSLNKTDNVCINVKIRGVRATIVAAEKQSILHECVSVA
jgi:hypothetical protein